MVKQKLLDSQPVWNQLLASVRFRIVVSAIDLESVILRIRLERSSYLHFHRSWQRISKCFFFLTKVKNTR